MKLSNIRISAAALAITSLGLLDCPASAKEIQPLASPGKSGAQMWAENCNRCHNVRSPQSYSPAQWEVAMLHMRVRANLTGEETRKILEFLKSSAN
jgi:mono/diheme cytochrome c family protein